MLARLLNVAHSYGGAPIFEDVNLLINEGDRIALIGENGSGKSTLFKLLASRLSPEQGQVVVSKGIDIGYLPQEPEIPENLSLAEFAASGQPKIRDIERQLRSLEVAMGDPQSQSNPDKWSRILSDYGQLQERFEREGGYEAEAAVAAVLQGLGFTESQFGQPVSVMSGGEKKLAGLAQLLVRQPDLILLDEPDNHLDLKGKEWLHEYIVSHNRAIAIISHDRYFLDQFINHIIELEDQHIQEYFGNYSAYRLQKRERLENAEQIYRDKQKELQQLEKSAKQLQEWASLNRKLSGRAHNHKRMLDLRRQELESTPVPILDRKTIHVAFDAERSGQTALSFMNVSVSIDGRRLFEPFNLVIRYGQRIGLVGSNGSGKTTLFRVIMGILSPTVGSIALGSNVKVGYYSQEQETLDKDSTPIEFIQSVKQMPADRAIALLKSKLLFEYDDCFNRIANLSGGEKSRLQIMGLALAGANLLLLDEPTNNLDIPSMAVLEESLDDFGGTIFAISHDRYFLDKMVDQIVAIDEGKVHVFSGNFSYYYQQVGGKVSLPA